MAEHGKGVSRRESAPDRRAERRARARASHAVAANLLVTADFHSR